MPDHEATVLDTLLSIDRARGEKLFVTVERYRDVEYAHIRLWYRDEFGVMRPTRKGITLKRHELDPIIDALHEAMGFLDAGD